MLKKCFALFLTVYCLSFGNLVLADEFEGTWVACGELQQENHTPREAMDAASSTWVIQFQSSGTATVWRFRQHFVDLRDNLGIWFFNLEVISSKAEVSSTNLNITVDATRLISDVSGVKYVIDRNTLNSRASFLNANSDTVKHWAECQISSEEEFKTIRATWAKMVESVRNENEARVEEANRALSDRKL